MYPLYPFCVLYMFPQSVPAMGTVTVRWPARASAAPIVRSRLVHWTTPPHSCYFWPTTCLPRSNPCRMGFHVASQFPTQLSVYLPLEDDRPVLQLPVLPGVTLVSYCSADLTDWGAAYDVPVQDRSHPTSPGPVPFMLDLSTEGTRCVTLEVVPSASGVYLRPQTVSLGETFGTFSRPLHLSTTAPYGMLYIVEEGDSLENLPLRFGQTCVDICDPRFPDPAMFSPSRYLVRHYELYVSNSNLTPRERDLLAFRRAMASVYTSPYANP